MATVTVNVRVKDRAGATYLVFTEAGVVPTSTRSRNVFYTAGNSNVKTTKGNSRTYTP